MLDQIFLLPGTPADSPPPAPSGMTWNQLVSIANDGLPWLTIAPNTTAAGVDAGYLLGGVFGVEN